MASISFRALQRQRRVAGNRRNVEYIEHFGRFPATFPSLASTVLTSRPATAGNREKLSNSRRVAGNSSGRRATATVAGNRKSCSSKKAFRVLGEICAESSRWLKKYAITEERRTYTYIDVSVLCFICLVFFRQSDPALLQNIFISYVSVYCTGCSIKIYPLKNALYFQPS